MPKNAKVLFIVVALGCSLLIGFDGSAGVLDRPALKERSKSVVFKRKMVKIKQLRRQIDQHRRTTWHYQRVAQISRTRAAYRDRWTKGVPDLKRLARLWRSRGIEARDYARELMAVVRHADRSLVKSGHASSPLRKELVGIVKASRTEGISPFFILAIAGKESTFGVHICDAYDAWGWDPCSDDEFVSFAHGARQVARGLRVKYLGQWGSRTIAEVGYDYCGAGCGSSWSSGVSSFLSSIFRAGYGMRWKDALRVVNR